MPSVKLSGELMQEIYQICLSRISKILAEFNKVFNFEKSLIYVLPKFN